MQDVGETVVDEDGLPALSIKVTDVNRHEHLDGIVRLESLSTAQGLTVGWIMTSYSNVRWAPAVKPAAQLKATPPSPSVGVLLISKRQCLVEGRTQSDVMDEIVNSRL